MKHHRKILAQSVDVRPDVTYELMHYSNGLRFGSYGNNPYFCDPFIVTAP